MVHADVQAAPLGMFVSMRIVHHHGFLMIKQAGASLEPMGLCCFAAHGFVERTHARIHQAQQSRHL